MRPKRSLALVLVAFLLVVVLAGCAVMKKVEERVSAVAPEGTIGAYGARITTPALRDHIVRLNLAKDGQAELVVDFLDKSHPVTKKGTWDYRMGRKVRIVFEGSDKGSSKAEMIFSDTATGLVLVRSNAEVDLPEGLTLVKNVNVSGPVWRLARIRLQDGKVIVPSHPARYALVLSPDGTITVLADCNRGMGAYIVAGKAIVMRDFVYTRMICAEDSLFDEYTQALRAAWSCSRSADRLTITFDRGKSALDFEPASDD